ncbi:MAG TPA: DPP IV N-terminal domain-containing protein [Gemmatimonadaceae bacterium]|nr:DPP IV N-terminal domain-containing protein [Gemmatimonadaceae bacterium]
MIIGRRLAALVMFVPAVMFAQGTMADYQRAVALQARYSPLVVDSPDAPVWTSPTQFWYRKTAKGGGSAIVVVDAASLTKRAGNAADTAGSGGGRGGRGGGAGAAAGGGRGGRGAAAEETRLSPDGQLVAYIDNFNIWIRPATGGEGHHLSTDGSEGNAYNFQSIVWSPNSQMIAAYRVRPGYHRIVHYVESSPADQLQPKTMERYYQKPGDVLDLQQPSLFHVAAAHEIALDNALFPNPYDLSRIEWRKDSRAFTFEYNQRGHQVYRVLEADANTGAVRSLMTETSKTFIDYRRTNVGLADSGRQYRYDLDDGREFIWMSERDGWAHLYMVDGATGAIKNQITKGNFVVRAVARVDEANKQIIFAAGGVNPKQDPYFVQYYRINFDGTGMTPLTDADGYHTVTFSPDFKYYVDTWSRVDLPPVSELRETSDAKVLMPLEKADDSELVKAGWRAPEVFVAKGRDGTTDIWGVIIKPSNFDPKKKYPVIENIYAGPQGSFVPKTFAPWLSMQSIAELGFIVVQIDGMGTAHRSKAFHDVAWKNLADAGFPDRILWHKAAAAKYPWYDISRVGIYGGSAGGQNSMGAMLFHPEFYKVAVSFAGCHDNRMDKVWWNELWMGWPVDESYERSSNMVNAGKLQGKLLLVWGELDTNVDPSSSMQVVNALIKNNKSFDMLVMPGEDHPAGRRGPSAPYGDRKLWDYFVHNLLHVEPPNWNVLPNGMRNAADGAGAGTGASDMFGPSWESVRAGWDAGAP